MKTDAKYDPERGDFFTPEGFRACLNCSYCCSVGPCRIAIHNYGDEWTSPCRSLIKKGGQFFCAEFMNPGITDDQRRYISDSIGGIGSGCSSPCGNAMRDAIRKSLLSQT